MVIVDTSVWVDHFCRPVPKLAEFIAGGSVLLHPFVYGELLLGGLPSKGEAAQQLLKIGLAPLASASEAAAFIEWAELSGTGVGYVDTHLLVAAKLHGDAEILTSDKRLLAEARRLAIACEF